MHRYYHRKKLEHCDQFHSLARSVSEEEEHSVCVLRCMPTIGYGGACSFSAWGAKDLNIVGETPTLKKIFVELKKLATPHLQYS